MSAHDPRYCPSRVAAERLERELNTRSLDGAVYTWADARPGAGARRWQVVRAPATGDDVSAVVGGTGPNDARYRPLGRVLAVEGDRHQRVETALAVFWRQGDRPCWRSAQGWTLVPGRHVG